MLLATQGRSRLTGPTVLHGAGGGASGIGFDRIVGERDSKNRQKLNTKSPWILSLQEKCSRENIETGLPPDWSSLPLML